MSMMNTDEKIRIAAFDWLHNQVGIHGDVLPRTLLEQDFTFGNERIPMVSSQGIFKSKLLDMPLCITTARKGPYYNCFSEEGFRLYRYRGSDINHRDNVGLREVIESSTPLVLI